MSARMKGYKKELGRKGEDIAAAFLLASGYHLLERNYRALRGEIDIIAEQGHTLVFVEVKTKRSEGFGEPEEWVDRRKQKQIGKVAEAYLQDHDVEERDCRFDVVAVVYGAAGPEVRHTVDAFWLEE